MKNNDGGVLVHCHKGVSRSAAIIVAFVMQDSNQLNYAQALQFVRGRRPIIWPNAGFQKQLILWYVMQFKIHDETGKEKREYLEWKAKNDAEIRQLG